TDYHATRAQLSRCIPLVLSSSVIERSGEIPHLWLPLLRPFIHCTCDGMWIAVDGICILLRKSTTYRKNRRARKPPLLGPGRNRDDHGKSISAENDVPSSAEPFPNCLLQRRAPWQPGSSGQSSKHVDHNGKERPGHSSGTEKPHLRRVPRPQEALGTARACSNRIRLCSTLIATNISDLCQRLVGGGDGEVHVFRDALASS
ncbi:hypothetical protein QBC46DRAFT_108577, partial [Diplogelasinospora grovesii]